MLLFALSACASRPTGAPVPCTPGAYATCTAPTGCAGTQQCNPAGTAFGACECTPADAGAGDAPRASCVPRAFIWCEGDAALWCSDDGGSTRREPCAFGCNSTTKRCNECAPMSAVCAGSDLVSCNAFGEASQRVCRHGCDAAGTACVIPSCPAEMRLVDELEVCIDRYEASQGPNDAAVAVRGAMPWVFVSYAGAEAACAMAGKRLCTEEEWVAACAGPQHNDYPFGYIYDPTACNGSGSPLEGVVPTSSAPRCEGGYPGIFDMGGNVMELTSACDGEEACKAYGGDYGADAQSMLCTAFNMASSHSPQAADGGAEPAGYASVGFRCCLWP